MKSLLHIAAISLIVALGLPGPGAATQCIAHRGASGDFPENTIEALDAAWEAGADVVEVDVRSIKDGTLVLFHDHAVNDRRIDTMTYEQLQREAPDYDIPTLADAFSACTETQMLLLDLKDDSSGFVTNLVAVIRNAGPSCPRLIFQSRHVPTLEKLTPHFNRPVTLYLTSLEREVDLSPVPSPQSVAATLMEKGLSGVSAKGRQFINRGYVEAFQKQGFLFYVWTVNPVDRIRHYMSLGVDGIITDFPGLLAAEKSARSTREATRARVLASSVQERHIAELEIEIERLRTELSELREEFDELQILKAHVEPLSELLNERINEPVIHEDWIGIE